MKNNRIDKYFKLVTVLIAIGLICIIAGAYFVANDLTSSGVTMSKYGSQYGTGTIDGKGIIFCGIIIAACGLIFKD